ncbi:MAG: ISNCY family transposase [Euryarchaeota archaeon]|nr:ISNCY family transposase [Euryarchaeota archaeon]
MTNKALSVIKGCISHIQLKLSDFSKNDPDTGKIITDRFTERTQPHNINERLVLLTENHFDLVNHIFQLYRSNHVTKQEYYERNPILGEFGPQKIYLKGICVKNAGKKFVTPFDSVVDPKHRYASVFKDSAADVAGIGYRSLRKTAEELRIFLRTSPSHQTIDRWMKSPMDVNEISIKNKTPSYSGYYCYDEEYIRINGQKCYRLTLYDSVFNIPVSEEISNNLKYDTIFSFLKRSLQGTPLYAITTDHVRMYKSIIDKLGALHQLCIFHFFKLIGDDVYDILKSEKTLYRDKIGLCMYFTDIKNVFRVYDEEIAIGMFETLINGFDVIPSVLQKCIRKKIIPDFDRLIAFMQDGLIARTSNQCGDYYQQTDSGEIKHKYRTPRGILAYLARKMEY